MSTFYQGAVGDWLIGAALGMLATEPLPDAAAPDEAVEQPTYRDAFANPRHTDFAIEADRLATEFPCGFCGCPGCYSCTPDADETCACGSER